MLVWPSGMRPTKSAMIILAKVTALKIYGRLKWQTSTGDRKRALVETTKGRFKGVIGPRLRARSFLAQQTEVATSVAILNRIFSCGHPKSAQRQASTRAPE